MEWSNEKVLELYQTEPCLRDPRLQTHKNRSTLSDAWRRIIQALSFPATQEQLKTKKESLMRYYRIHLNKLKKSIKSGFGSDDIKGVSAPILSFEYLYLKKHLCL